MIADELAVTLAFAAQAASDTAKAREALLLSDGSVSKFLKAQGPRGKEAARSRGDSRPLKSLAAFLRD